jgi:hypothetical protein
MRMPWMLQAPFHTTGARDAQSGAPRGRRYR